MSHISLQNVEIAFSSAKGRFVAVRDINLDIERGEIIAIIGHSGCGKSTILNAIAGMVNVSRGDVLIHGKPVNGPGPDRGVVFQHYSLLPWLTVEKNILTAVDSVLKDKTKAEKAETVEYFLKAVNLYQHRHKLPSEISGGMKQRTAIARAFAINPDILLLDEPFGALDALTKSTMHVELLKLWNLDNRNKTIVMVTHDIEEAIFLADRIVVMTDGPAATIREIENVTLDRPRHKKDIAHDPRYNDIRDRLLELLVDKLSIADIAV
ncbi:ABC transporter ATP-binding protein [Tellurirhabdus rosea]|uniref:ABC transporter ATP-binding protein n=1 Tax=Tellurirhabdus rosea TaxID=2674997 RepID=UPI00225B8407|nr:ABC transporter ATP-binding protein [Tellurirhabdus rosea]